MLGVEWVYCVRRGVIVLCLEWSNRIVLAVGISYCACSGDIVLCLVWGYRIVLGVE